MTNDVKFGKLLGDYRACCGWSQEELAKRVRVSRNAIVGWERHASMQEGGKRIHIHDREEPSSDLLMNSAFQRGTQLRAIQGGDEQ